MSRGHAAPPAPSNEPILGYLPGSPERGRLKAALEQMASETLEIPMVIGGERVKGPQTAPVVMPHDHGHVLGRYHVGEAEHTGQAIEAALKVRAGWSRVPYAERAAIFLRAAALAAGPWRDRLNASTMLGQSKTAYQAEIDAACELVDFFRFNAWYGQEIVETQPPISPPGVWNTLDYRPLDGFVFAASPFNFTSIAANLPTAPALMGNTVVWKPSLASMHSAWQVMGLLEEAGLPPGVINLVTGDPAAVAGQALGHPLLGGVHFTGSTGVLRQLFQQVGENIGRYRQYPRIVGESGGKDFIFVHPSAEADLEAVATAVVRGGYEYQGQKCSAASRLYIPQSLWPALEARLVALIEALKVGDVRDLSTFMGAVIHRGSFEKIKGYIALAKDDPALSLRAGGGCDDSTGYFVQPTLIRSTDPGSRLMREEIFGPVVTAYVYPDRAYEETLRLCDQTAEYALTGALFARDRHAVQLGMDLLRETAGNFYLNDKPTGAVVGQQPFGGGRASGTNDKAGSALNLLRWTSPRTVKETFTPPTQVPYPYMDEA